MNDPWSDIIDELMLQGMPIVCKRFLVMNTPPAMMVVFKFFKAMYPKRFGETIVLLDPANTAAELSRYLGPPEHIPQHIMHGTCTKTDRLTSLSYDSLVALRSQH